jgi:hypothetical protein
MDKDLELAAMKSIYDALSGLPNKESQVRAITWATDRLGIKLENSASQKPTTVAGRHVNLQKDSGLSTFETLADLFSGLELKTDVERVLAAAAYMQEKNGLADFASRDINQELTHMGHPSSNITRDLGALMERKPKLIIQTRKDGKTKQAQKRYRVTTEGLRKVITLLSGESEG